VLVRITYVLVIIACVGQHNICVGEYNICVGEYNIRPIWKSMPWFGTAVGTYTEPCSVIIYEITIEKNVVVR
jgi:hypothetical protein